MRGKKLIILLSLMLLLTSCGQNEERITQDNNSSNIETNENEAVVLNAEEDPFYRADIIDITLVGEDKAEVRIESEEITSIIQSNEIESSIYFTFLIGDENDSGIRITPDGWVYFISVNGEGDEEYYDFDDPFSIDADVLTFTVNVEGIKDKLEKCDSYYLDAYDEEREEIILYSNGLLDELFSYEESDYMVEIRIINNDECIITLSGTAFEGYEDADEHQELQILLAPEEVAGFLYKYRVNLSVYSDGMGSCEVDEMEHVAEKISETETNYESNYINTTYGDLIYNENQYQILITHEGIGNGIMECSQVSVEDGNTDTVYYSTSVENILLTASEIDYNIPDEFTSSNSDGEYFYPSTNAFVIAMYEFPAHPIFEYGIAYPYGKTQPVYMPVYATEEPVTYITLTSYANNEIIDVKTKIVYQSVESMTLNACSRLDWCDAIDFNDDPDHDQVLIDDFMLNVDNLTFGEARDSSYTEYEYYGFDENVRYFNASIKNVHKPYIYLNEDLIINGPGDFEANGFAHFTLSYAEDFPDFDEGISDLRDYQVPVTVWASDAFLNE